MDTENNVILSFDDKLPEKVFFVDENGKFIDKPTTEKTTIVKYWSEKSNTLGFIMLVSSVLLIIILLGESNLITNFVITISEVLGALL
jgi:hypothetical protein